MQLDPVAQDAALASMGTTMQTAPRAENKGRKGTGYMGNTRQPHDKDRRNKGRKASGFTNCFQSQETADFNVTGSSHTVGGIQILPDFTPDEDLQNCIEERRPSNPSLSPEGTIPESAFKPEGFSTGTVRAVTVRRRQREREEEEGENKDKTMTSKSSESEAQAGAMQRKLVQMWDCLQVSEGVSEKTVCLCW